MELKGTIIAGEQMNPVEGTVRISDGVIREIDSEPVDSSDIIMPSFVNAHTHIGDSIAKEAGRGLSVKAVVEPPDGLKHRLLADASRDEIRQAMETTIEYMAHSGVGTFVDFRENGIDGVETLRAAAQGLPIDAVALGRGDPSVVEIGDGYGASVVHYRDFGPARTAATKADKPFGIHAGERNTADIGPSLSLDPDFLVHMNCARDEDLRTVEQQRISIAVCPRSNLVTGAGLPPIERFLEATTVALGTDNVMLNSPSMWREMEFVSKLCDVSDRNVLRMATVNGARLLGRENIGTIDVGKRARVTVLDGSGSLSGVRDTVAGIVRRAGTADVKSVVFETSVTTRQ